MHAIKCICYAYLQKHILTHIIKCVLYKIVKYIFNTTKLDKNISFLGTGFLRHGSKI